MFVSDFDQDMQGATLPASLQSLMFGDRFNQCLQGVALPDSLRVQAEQAADVP